MSFTSVEARAALIDILSAFQSQTNLPGLEAARAEAGNDMVKQMQLVFPAVTRIQAQVISRYVILIISVFNIHTIMELMFFSLDMPGHTIIHRCIYIIHPYASFLKLYQKTF